MRAREVGLVLFAIVREAAGAGCPIVPPVGSPVPHQAAVFEAVSAGLSHADVNLPAKLDGFNRTVTVEGLCANAVTSSADFTCQSGGGEFFAAITASATPTTLTFGDASCTMSGISIYQTGKTTGFAAEMRLQFDGCHLLGASPGGQPIPARVSNAAVVVGIRKDLGTKDFNLLAWSKQVCKTITTTTAAPAQVSQETDAFMQPVGDGTCEATIRRKIENITSEDNCKLQCIGSATSAQILGAQGCRGFAFNKGANGATCLTYSGDVLKSTTNAGWKCFNMSFHQNTYYKSTVAPPTVVKEIPELLYVQQATAEWGPGAMGYLHEISPPADSPTCFSPMWWFQLEDERGQPLSVNLRAADWDEFMSRIPTLPATKNVVSAPMVLDRVMFNTCAKHGWGQQTCAAAPVVMGHSSNPQCQSEEITATVVSGVMTVLLTWILVGVIFKICSLSRRSATRGEYTKLDGPQAMDGSSKGEVSCDTSVVALLSLVAAGGAFLCQWISMQFLKEVLSSSMCYDFDEFLVVILCVVISAALAIILILGYMSGFRHAHPLVRDVGNTMPPVTSAQTGSHIMLVDVEDGKTVGSVHHSMTDHQGAYGNSPMQTPNASFVSGGPGMGSQGGTMKP